MWSRVSHVNAGDTYDCQNDHVMLWCSGTLGDAAALL